MKNKPRRSRHTHWDESAEETHVVASVSRSTQTDAIDCGQQRIEELVLSCFFSGKSSTNFCTRHQSFLLHLWLLLSSSLMDAVFNLIFFTNAVLFPSVIRTHFRVKLLQCLIISLYFLFTICCWMNNLFNNVIFYSEIRDWDKKKTSFH